MIDTAAPRHRIIRAAASWMLPAVQIFANGVLPSIHDLGCWRRFGSASALAPSTSACASLCSRSRGSLCCWRQPPSMSCLRTVPQSSAVAAVEQLLLRPCWRCRLTCSELHRVAAASDDAEMCQFIEDNLLREQAEDVKFAADLVSRARR